MTMAFFAIGGNYYEHSSHHCDVYLSVRVHDPALRHPALESEPSIQKVALSPVKVDFIEAKSEARLFSHKNEFSVTLQADGEPPCDLCVLLEEGAMPLNLTNFKSHCTIAHTDLADGTAKKFTFTYQRMQKKLPLYFRIIAADRSLPLKVVPETQKIK